MKEAIITDLYGLFIDVEIVDDNETGYLPLFEVIDDQETITGYRVSVPVPQGLYHPKFNFLAWDEYKKPLEYQVDENGELVLDENENPIPIVKVVGDFWIEGLSQEEIDELKNVPIALTPEQESIQKLETDNALLLLDLAETQSKQQQAEQDNANLLLQQAETEERMVKVEQDYASLLLQLAEKGGV
ncbi:hypothetical protein SAMN05444162_3465 [Paenibacillaceae bacterium GAS479]|nr:hypothetical protein SAMN05444162_3465 [Paenibacillaceae bacterium GAS479]